MATIKDLLSASDYATYQERREYLKSISFFSLPARPSQQGYNAEDIRRKAYEPDLQVFDWFYYYKSETTNRLSNYETYMEQLKKNTSIITTLNQDITTLTTRVKIVEEWCEEIEEELNTLISGEENKLIFLNTIALIEYLKGANANDLFLTQKLYIQNGEIDYYWITSISTIRNNEYEESNDLIPNGTKIGYFTLNQQNTTKINLDNYYTKEEVDKHISDLKKAHLEVVDTLPSVGEEGIIYLLKSESGDTYNQWVYEEEQFINIGTTEINLENYYTKEEINALISGSSDNKGYVKVSSPYGSKIINTEEYETISDGLDEIIKLKGA